MFNAVLADPASLAKLRADTSVSISVCVVDPVLGGYNIGSLPIYTCLVSVAKPISAVSN